MSMLSGWAAMNDRAVGREPELEMWREPVERERVAVRPQIVEHVLEILPDKVRQH